MKIAEQKRAEGIAAVLQVQATGLGSIYSAAGDDAQLAQFYLALQSGIFNKDGLYAEIADKSAKAIHGLNPKINICNTGPSDGKEPFSNVIRDLAKSVPPLTDALNQQLGLEVPYLMKNTKEPHN